MKQIKPHQIALSFILLGASFSSHAQLMFSQYIDGSSNKKGLEIYNPDLATVNLADYEVKQYANGSASATATFKLVGNLASKQKFILGHNNLKAVLNDKVNQTANLAFNGDDAVVLFYKGTPVDRFGRVGELPSNGGWGNPSSKGNSFKRNATTNPVSSIDPQAVFNLNAEWTVWSGRDDFDRYLGGDTTTPPVIDKVTCSSQDTHIADLQTAAQGQRYTVRGVMTADYRYSGGFSGFYIQTPDSKAKANLTNAIFVYIPNGSAIKGGKVGDEVILNGRLNLYQNQLQLDKLEQDPLSCTESVSSLVTPISLNLPFASLEGSTGHVPKRYQGMLVKFPQPLTVSENYNYARYGELALSLNRLYIPTNLYPPKSVEATEMAKQNLLSKIILDDGFSKEYITPWLPSSFNANNTLRSGYQLNNVEGILEYRYTSWRIQPIQGKPAPQMITTTNPRTILQAKNTQHVRVAAFNVLNYDNGRNGFPTERGAKSKAQFDKQHAKIVSAMKSIDADVYTLMEIANNGYDDKSAVAHLARGLGPDWAYVKPEKMDRLGTDVIAVAIIYNTKRVKPVGVTAVFDDQSKKNRVTMAQSFQPLNGGKVFTVMPNHLKSKGCKDANGLDQDQNDGQSCWNPTRLKAVQAQIQWMAKNPTQVEKPNFLMLGDMNSYAKEDPILALEKANFKTLLNDEKIGQGKLAYSYVFGVASDAKGNGGAGNLDHALADNNLYPFVKKAFTWAINADEPTALGYEEANKSAEQIAAFYSDDAYRSSDHDPVIVDLDFNQTTEGGGDNGDKDDNKGSSGGGSSGLWSILGLVALAASRRRWQSSKQ